MHPHAPPQGLVPTTFRITDSARRRGGRRGTEDERAVFWGSRGSSTWLVMTLIRKGSLNTNSNNGAWASGVEGAVLGGVGCARAVLGGRRLRRISRGSVWTTCLETARGGRGASRGPRVRTPEARTAEGAGRPAGRPPHNASPCSAGSEVTPACRTQGPGRGQRWGRRGSACSERAALGHRAHRCPSPENSPRVVWPRTSRTKF